MNGNTPNQNMRGPQIVAQMFRSHGKWCIHIYGPAWLIKDFCEELDAEHFLAINGPSGEVGGSDLSMLLEVKEHRPEMIEAMAEGYKKITENLSRE